MLVLGIGGSEVWTPNCRLSSWTSWARPHRHLQLFIFVHFLPWLLPGAPSGVGMGSAGGAARQRGGGGVSGAWRGRTATGIWTPENILKLINNNKS